MKFGVILLIFVVNSVFSSTPLQSVFSRGLQLLSQFIQPNVFDSLQQRLSQPPQPPKGEEDEAVPGFWATLLKSFGLHSDQSSAAGVNILLFLVQAVSSAFSTDSETPQPSQPKSLLETLIQQPKISRLLSTMHNPKLTEIVLEEAESSLSDQSSGCVMQLLCRGSPIIQGMQKSLEFFLNKPMKPSSDVIKGETGEPLPKVVEDELARLKSTWTKLTPIERLFFFMPPLTDFQSMSKLCKQKYKC